MVGWKFWKKRTAEDIQKAELLESANHALFSAKESVKEGRRLSAEDLLNKMLGHLLEAKFHIDKTKDDNFIAKIDEIIEALKSAKKHAKTNRPEQNLEEARAIITKLVDLEEFIEKEIKRL